MICPFSLGAPPLLNGNRGRSREPPLPAISAPFHAMETATAKQQRRPPPAAGEGEPEAKRSRLRGCPDSAGGRRRVVLNPADCDLVRGGYLSSIRPIYSPHYSDPGRFGQRNLPSQKDHVHSPEQAGDTSLVYDSTKPVYTLISQGLTDEEEEDTCSTKASSRARDEDVNSQESIEEAPPHMANPNVEETGPSPSPVEVTAPPNPPSGGKSLSPSASLQVQNSVLLPGTVVKGHTEPVPSAADFPEHGIEWPEGPQAVPLAGTEIVLDTLISSVRGLFQQEEEAQIPTVEAVRSALERGTRAYHILGLPKEPWITAVESTWEEFRRAHAASEWKSCRLEIQRLEDEISALSDEARGLLSKAEDARGRRSALEDEQAAGNKELSHYRQVIRYFMEEAQKLAAAAKTRAKAVEQLQAEEATFRHKDSDLQREIATRRARIQELNKKKNPHVGSLTSSSVLP